MHLKFADFLLPLLFVFLFLLLLMLVDEAEEMCVLVLDVCEFAGHFAFEEEVAEVSFLEEPAVEVTEGALAAAQGGGLVGQGGEQFG
jgi:hypothetical protein